MCCEVPSELGNGETISFWWDIWTQLGRHIDLFGNTGPRELSIPLFSSVCHENGWRLRGARSHAAESLQIHLTGTQLNSTSQNDDVFYWLVDGDAMARYLPLTLGRRYETEPLWSLGPAVSGSKWQHHDTLCGCLQIGALGLLQTAVFVIHLQKQGTICFYNVKSVNRYGTWSFEGWASLTHYLETWSGRQLVMDHGPSPQ